MPPDRRKPFFHIDLQNASKADEFILFTLFRSPKRISARMVLVFSESFIKPRDVPLYLVDPTARAVRPCGLLSLTPYGLRSRMTLGISDDTGQLENPRPTNATATKGRTLPRIIR